MKDHSTEWYAGYSKALSEIKSWKVTAEPLTRLEYHIRKLRPQPGDVVVFKCQEVLTEEQVRQLRSRLVEALENVGHHHEVVIVSAGCELTTRKKESAA